MTYVAKDLPRWVRFRDRPVSKPMFGPPTLAEHRMIEATRLWASHVAATLELDLSWVTTPTKAPLRVQLPSLDHKG